MLHLQGIFIVLNILVVLTLAFEYKIYILS